MRGYEKDPEYPRRKEILELLIAAGCDLNKIKSNSKMTALHWIAFHEDFDTLRYVLTHHPKIYFNSDSLSALDIAGLTKRFSMVDIFLDYFYDELIGEASPNAEIAPDVMMNSTIIPLNSEVQSGNRIKLLKVHRKDLSQQERAYIRFMFWAAQRGRSNIVEQLIRRGVSPFLKDMNWRNALMAATLGNKMDIV